MPSVSLEVHTVLHKVNHFTCVSFNGPKPPRLQGELKSKCLEALHTWICILAFQGDIMFFSRTLVALLVDL